MKEYRLTRIIWLLCLALAMTGCSEDLTSSVADDEIKPGDPVLFAPYLSGRAMTRTDVSDYHDASAYYTFTYEMYQSAVVDPVASGLQLYWPDNINAYGFKATAGSATLATDQTTQTKFFAEDKLLGYGAIASTADNIEALNYRTSKNWKADNETDGVSSPDSKKIRLYLKHLRSRITVILKAGEGVSRDDLANTNYLEAKIYSYGTSNLEISPWATNTTIDYDDASSVSTTQYTAIVEPYAYQTNAKTIAEIKLSNQVFTFSASNDNNDVKYNLSAGQHLTITATLSRGSDGDIYQVKMTAQVTDWDITNIAATVNNEGQIGSTTDIGTREDLLAFLTDADKNKAGNIANIIGDINLETSGDWTSQPLNCTMKMNDKTFTTTHRIFSTIGVGGKLVGGTISVGGDVDAAIAETNRGTIQNITVDRTSTAKATIAGLVVTNSGTISNCRSYLPVHGTSGVVGGITKESVYHSDNGSMPVIEGCIANARVEGSGDTVGGGIVGRAVGRVSGNTFEYGITILQDATNFKNIVGSKYDDEAHHQLRAYNNTWPTNADNTIGDDTKHNENMTSEANRFNATIDSQAELAAILSNTNNLAGRKYRLSDDFKVTETGMGGYGWTNDYSTIDAAFFLDGNNKNITTDPTTLILFGEIGTHTTNLKVNGNPVSTP